MQTSSVAHPASYPMDTGESFSGHKWPGHGANHSPPSSAEIKNTWSCTSITPHFFMAWCLIKHLSVSN